MLPTLKEYEKQYLKPESKELAEAAKVLEKLLSNPNFNLDEVEKAMSVVEDKVWVLRRDLGRYSYASEKEAIKNEQV